MLKILDRLFNGSNEKEVKKTSENRGTEDQSAGSHDAEPE